MRMPRSTLGITAIVLAAAALAVPAVAAPSSPAAPSSAAAVAAGNAETARLPQTPELSTTTRLAGPAVRGDRRPLLRDWTEDGRYPATGFHTRGEMGGFWTPPIKLLDGLWFGVDGQWLGDDVAARVHQRLGLQRMDLAARDGVTGHAHRLRARRAAGRAHRPDVRAATRDTRVPLAWTRTPS